MREPSLQAVEDLLKNLPGVVAARRLEGGVRARALEIEEQYEQSAVLPVKNLGVKAAVQRHTTLVVLKDSAFRQPGAPTVYMVEEQGEGSSGPMSLVVAGRHYKVIGEEILATRGPSAEQAIALSDGFVMYPGRRSGGDVPCYFILPPLGFPELEVRGGELGIRDVVSISPSVALDEYVRRELGFPLTNELATVLIGFNQVSPDR